MQITQHYLIETEKELQKCLGKILRARENYEMELNILKTKLMVAPINDAEVIKVVVRLKLEQVE